MSALPTMVILFLLLLNCPNPAKAATRAVSASEKMCWDSSLGRRRAHCATGCKYDAASTTRYFNGASPVDGVCCTGSSSAGCSSPGYTFCEGQRGGDGFYSALMYLPQDGSAAYCIPTECWGGHCKSGCQKSSSDATPSPSAFYNGANGADGVCCVHGSDGVMQVCDDDGAFMPSCDAGNYQYYFAGVCWTQRYDRG